MHVKVGFKIKISFFSHLQIVKNKGCDLNGPVGEKNREKMYCKTFPSVEFT